tara:strand:- start:708 stop:3029 length:2322 start_codon:yes stop_codon:yes gene_type:complete
MPLVSSSLPNMINGVSQQPAPIRLETSCKEMINAFPSIVTGLQKRPNTNYIASLNTSVSIPNDAGIHLVQRDATEKYFIVCVNGDLEVYDIDGTKKTVSFPNGKSYLSTSKPNEQLRFLSVGDQTWIVNTSVTTTASATSETRTDPRTQATIYIFQAVANKTYAIFVNNVLRATHTTQTNVSAATALEGTDEIAQNLANALAVSGISSTVENSAVCMFGLQTGDKVEVTEGFGGRSMRVFKDEIQEFSKLPPSDVDNRLVKVRGDVEESGDDFWVTYLDNVWTETVGFNAGRQFNATTMPHILVRNANGTFTFSTDVWNQRLAGDDNTNIDPSFVGGKINDIFLHKGRMGLLSGENVIFSENQEFENFWRTTTTQLLDTERIDVASTTNRISNLHHAVPYNKTLMLFSDKVQFEVSEGDFLSPKTIGLDVTTSFDASITAKPTAVGPNVYFAVDGTSHANLRELFITDQTDNKDSSEITIQIPRYIPANIIKMASSTTDDIMAVLSSGDRNRLYIYKWHMSGDQKLQSSWGTWTFPAGYTVLTMEFLEQDLFIIYKSNSGVHIDKLTISEGEGVDGTPNDVLLDRRVTQAECTKSFDSATNRTTITVPYSESETWQLVESDGTIPNIISQSATQIVVEGDFTAKNFHIGLVYRFEYQFSTQFLREGDRGSQVPIQDGRLQIRYMSLLYLNTSQFDIDVTATNKPTKTYTFTGRVLGASGNIIGQTGYDTGEFRFPVFSKNDQVEITIKNETPFNSAFSSTEWEAMYTPKTRRI